MKHTINILASFLLLLIFTVSCVDDSIDFYQVEKPESIAELEYLNDYDFLKSYVDRNANPNFKLGAGVTVSEYLQRGHLYRVVNSNFDALTAGNAMKYASVVADNGAMNFGPVTQFVAAAREAGINIYGHTLVWHAQQNKKYLESLIKDREIEVDPDAKLDVEDKTTDFSTMTEFPFYVMGYKPDIVDGILVSNYPGSWYQYFVVDGISTVPGREYKVTAMIKASKAGAFNVQMGNWGATTEKQISVTTEWAEQFVTFDAITTVSSFVVFQPGTFDGEIQIQWVRVSHSEAPTVSVPKYIYESDFSDGVPIGGWGNGSTRTVVDGVMQMVNPSAVNFWQAQAAIDFTSPLESGKTHYLSFKIKGSAPGVIRPGFQDPSDYSSGGDFPNINFTADWQEFTVQTTVTKETVTRFLFSYGDFAGTIYIDDLSLYTMESVNSIPLTPEEKADTLTYALRNWISGMMGATSGYVTEWDVVNEPLAGQGNIEGFYDLKSAVRGTVSAADAANSFYWQDYLGVDYVRVAVKLAREYGPDNLKLFVNDYNLESDWDDNHKLKSLIYWINRWESDGVTEIDGIGTQMHISYYMNPDVQASKEEHIVQMFELLAQTGKLIKITELDMGLVDATGQAVKTSEVTIEQHKAMSDHYKFIIQKYFEIIPANQRAGITHWCITDSPESSSWRGGEPVGLWTERTYRRKHAYGGFADGLSGK